MSGRGILDADMHMIGSWLVQGWRWWVGELRNLVPERLRRSRGDRLPRLIFAEDGLSPERGDEKSARPGSWSGVRATIGLPRELCLTRYVERPTLNARDLQHMLTLEGDMLLPFPAGTMLVTGRALDFAGSSGRMRIEVAGLPLDTANEIAETVAATGVLAVHVVMQEPHGSLPPIDFAPSMRAAGLIPKPRNATPLVWSLVGFLVVLNLATLIWRDTASVARLEQIVREQQPAVAVAETIMRRTQRDQALVARSLASRRRHDALGALAAVSDALPDGAWLQRYVWDGPTLRLTGYRPARSDVGTALRRAGRFSEVRSMTDETQATVPAGDPFDISARIAPR